MGKPKTNQKGFSAVETILVLVIVVLIGTVGYLVYKNHHKATTANTTNTAKTSTSTTSSSTTNPYAGWNTYTATLLPVSFKYPKDWTIDNSTGNAPINQPDNQFVRLNAPQRSIDGVNYQFSLTFQIHDPSLGDETPLPVYTSTKLTDPNYPKPLYSLILLNNAPSGTANAGQAGSIEVSTTSYQSGANTDGNDTIPTSTTGQQINQEIDMGGTYTQVSDNTLAYFTPSEFSSLQEVQQAELIFSSLSQH